jgi:exonuclease VII small subunit
MVQSWEKKGCHSKIDAAKLPVNKILKRKEVDQTKRMRPTASFSEN